MCIYVYKYMYMYSYIGLIILLSQPLSGRSVRIILICELLLSGNYLGRAPLIRRGNFLLSSFDCDKSCPCIS